MNRKVYFTEEQLKKIIGEDAVFSGGYLDNTSTGSEYSTDSIPATCGEVIPTEPGGEPKTTDAYASQKIRNNQWLRRGSGYSLYENRKKKLNERNAELDGKDMFTLPKELRVYATPDGSHDEIMNRLRSGEPMNIASLYRLRNELQDSSNIKIKRGIDLLIKQAQTQGESLRNSHPMGGNTQNNKASKNNKPTIYYDNNQ